MKHLKAVIFDWAGTTVDYGSRCPILAFQQAFADHGLDIASWDVRRFMGWHKKDHLRAILALPHVAEQWRAQHPEAPTEDEIDALYAASERILRATVTDYAQLLPGVLETIKWCRLAGLRIGSTTGYTSPMMAPLLPVAAKQGYVPDFWIASDQAPAGRPAPWMFFRNLEALQVFPPRAAVKVGDAVVDIEEGLNAGAWTVGVVATSSLLGLSEAELNALPESERSRQMAEARRLLRVAGAHFVIDGMADLPAILEEIDALCAEGLEPVFRVGGAA